MDDSARWGYATTMGGDIQTIEDARAEFADLVRTQRLNALWFLSSAADPQFDAPQAERYLAAIAQHGNREVWQRARRLQTWRSRYFKPA